MTETISPRFDFEPVSCKRGLRRCFWPVRSKSCVTKSNRFNITTSLPGSVFFTSMSCTGKYCCWRFACRSITDFDQKTFLMYVFSSRFMKWFIWTERSRSCLLPICFHQRWRNILYCTFLDFTFLCWAAQHSPALHYTTLHHTTPHYTTPQHTTSHHTMPYHTTPYHTIPHHTTPYHTISYHTIPHHTIPYHTIPYYTTPYHTIHTTTHHATPYHTIPHHSIPYQTTPDHIILYHTIPYHITPHRTIPHHTTLHFTVICTVLHCAVSFRAVL